MTRLYKILSVLLIIAAVCVVLAAEVFAEDDGGLLIISGMTPDSPYAYEFCTGVKASAGDTEIYIEYLYEDLPNTVYNDSATFNAIAARMSSHPPVRAVIPADNFALSFVLRYRSELGLSDTPIVLTAITDQSLASAAGNSVGETLGIDFAKIEEMFTKLFPSEETLFFVCDDTEFEQGISAQYNDYLEECGDTKIVYTDEEVTDAPVLCCGVYEDEVLTDTPVFTIYDVLLGEGSLGGSVISADELGQCAVKTAMGENAVPESRLYVDYTAAKNFGVDITTVPKKTKYVNYRENFKEKYGRKLAVGSLLVIALLFFMQLVSRWFESRVQNRLLQRSAETLKTSMNVNLAVAEAKEEYIKQVSGTLRDSLDRLDGRSAEGDNNEDELKNEISLLRSSVSEFLDISCDAETGEISSEEVVFSPLKELNQTAADFEKLSRNQSIKFSFDKSKLDDREVCGDRKKLCISAMSLLLLAADSSGEGGKVTLAASFNDADAENGDIPESADLLLDVGYSASDMSDDRTDDQADESTNKPISKPTDDQAAGSTDDVLGNKGGTAAALVKKYISVMGGQLSSESSKDAAAMRAEIPLKLEKTEEEVIPEFDPSLFDYHGVRVVVAEHNELNLAIIKEMLRAVKIDPIGLRDSRDAVYTFNKAHIGEIDMIILDSDSPMMGGIDAAYTIRKSRHANSTTIPIALLASRRGRNDRTETSSAQRAGIDAVLHKPVDERELYEMLERLMPEHEDEEY